MVFALTNDLPYRRKVVEKGGASLSCLITRRGDELTFTKDKT
jgi:hypothetical protein